MQGRKHFELAELRRIPVTVSAAAQAVIDASSDEGRRFPQALADVLGSHAGIARVRVELAPYKEHFPVHPAEDPEATLLCITAEHSDAGNAEHRWLLESAVLAQQPMHVHGPGFRAHRGAQDLLHTYPHPRPQTPTPSS